MRKILTLIFIVLFACATIIKITLSREVVNTNSGKWQLSEDSKHLVTDQKLYSQISKALSAAEHTGTDPILSHYQVRTATAIEKNGKDNIVVGGNTEYSVPEAIHGEAALINHVTSLYGAETTRHDLHFVAFYSDHCSTSGSCGDCRDFQKAATDYSHLLVVCGQASDHTIHVTKFSDQLVDEKQFPGTSASALPVTSSELARLNEAATAALTGGVTLFSVNQHTAAAALSYSGKIYKAAGADDAAFHYRYPIGGTLQQAATENDYLLRAILVLGNKGQWPQISYRDRQYGYEFSAFNRTIGKPPIALIISDGLGNYRATSFEDALPDAFSTAGFKPQAVKDFLKQHMKLSSPALNTTLL